MMAYGKAEGARMNTYLYQEKSRPGNKNFSSTKGSTFSFNSDTSFHQLQINIYDCSTLFLSLLASPNFSPLANVFSIRMLETARVHMDI